MRKSSIFTLYKRYEWMSSHLEQEAYQQQTKLKRKITQFFPCEKALVFTKAMSNPNGVVVSLVIYDAALTICKCHSGLSAKDLWNLYDQATIEIPQEVEKCSLS